MDILLIDDEKTASMQYYQLELKEAGFTNEQCVKPDEALEKVRQHGKELKLIILDNLMPAGQRYAVQDTDGGTLVGKLLYDEIREVLPETPILILSNFPDLEWLPKATQTANTCVVSKQETRPSQLIPVVQQMLKKKS